MGKVKSHRKTKRPSPKQKANRQFRLGQLKPRLMIRQGEIRGN
jgi:hypothetical protein